LEVLIKEYKMDPFTIAILGGTALGGLSYLDRMGEEGNLDERQAAARARGVGVNYGIPDVKNNPGLLQSLITGAATGTNLGQQVGLAKNLMNKNWEKPAAEDTASLTNQPDAASNNFQVNSGWSEYDPYTQDFKPKSAWSEFQALPPNRRGPNTAQDYFGE